jgi:hypothetical protein
VVAGTPGDGIFLFLNCEDYFLPAYDSRTTALVLGIGAKELDNVLSRYRLPGVIAPSQGVGRRIGTDAIVRLAIGQELRAVLGCTWERGLAVADELERSNGLRSPGGFLSIALDSGDLRRALSRQLLEATEFVVRPRRGRPPGR